MNSAQPPAGKSGDQMPGVALIAHDRRKEELLLWAGIHREFLLSRPIYATATTGALLRDRLGLPVHLMHSGPRGGDQQIGAHIARGAINVLIFFWDPLAAYGHSDDVRALLRLATLLDIYMACGPATATAIAGLLASPGALRPTVPTQLLRPVQSADQ